MMKIYLLSLIVIVATLVRLIRKFEGPYEDHFFKSFFILFNIQ
jgi:hypothetical protein